MRQIVHILITGGAGFIGSHVADELLEEGHTVRILDNLDPQVHGVGRRLPPDLNGAAKVLVGDVRNRDQVLDALDGVDAVIHLAAKVGVGQSMYEIETYTDVNERGTAVLLDALAERPVRKLIVASSMSVYGEGLMRDRQGGLVETGARTTAQLGRGQWDLRSFDDQPLDPLPTPETKRPELNSVYALNKFAQERMCLLMGRAYGIDTVALRLFNVYGPRQALSNPYTGVIAIFASRLLNDRRPLVFEDGQQRRDFVHVSDVARAFRLALERDEAAGYVLNIASGHNVTIRQIARRLAEALGRPHLTPRITAQFRVGDIRHCFADTSLAQRVLGFEARISLEEGLHDLLPWLAGQVAVDRSEDAMDELARRGLVA
jgi:dTDP-L-rhamnose 4-epimerase